MNEMNMRMNQAEAQHQNQAQEYRVSELSSYIKRCIEDNFGYIRVRGEISGLKIASSGHGYFNLKDNDAILACTCWKNAMSRLSFKLEDGMEVIATGKLTTYAGQSKYQLSVEKIESSGAGALMAMLLKRKEALAKEGLFDQAKKLKLPFFPSRIGVITSPVGAVIQDILHRVRDRCPTHVILWPVAVQGEQCSFEVSSAINGFNSMNDSMRPDVIIVARGGGSIEDLWGFNEEIVCRAAASSRIPIISAIGHETDITLLDFASSVRAPTPTAAAEMALPVLSEIMLKMSEFDFRLKNALVKILERYKNKLALLFRSFESAKGGLFSRYQKLDDLSFRLQNSLPNNLKIKQAKLASAILPYNQIHSMINSKSASLLNIHEKISSLIGNILKTYSMKLDLNGQLLSSMSVGKILSRGFVLARSKKVGIIHSVFDAQKENSFELQWHDGKILVNSKGEGNYESG
ncbi:MAG: exodeoxyribonuclease VII large subunit [Rickettsiaceae bacterium]|nr:exodeoxyribonuclease VII large subunit [Rickettsiaceae bacterium]